MNIRAALRAACESILDAIIPPRQRSARTKARTIDQIPFSPTAHDLLGEHITTIMRYQESAVQDLIRSLKYDGSGHAARLAASVLADYLREEIAAARQFSPREILLVPVPLHTSRSRERGFNQIELVLRTLPEEFKDGTLSRFAPETLVRSRETPPQTKLSRAERIKNVAGAFSTPDQEAVRSKRIFLIDDVATTGATLKCAGAPLTVAGAEVYLLALARA
jgi:ComF family protein